MDSEVKDNAEVSTRETPLGSSYDALVTTAALDKDGALSVLVINRSPEDDIKSRVELGSFRHATTVDVSVVAGRTSHDFNDAEYPDAVTIKKSRGGGSRWPLPGPRSGRSRGPAARLRC